MTTIEKEKKGVWRIILNLQRYIDKRYDKIKKIEEEINNAQDQLDKQYKRYFELDN